MGLSSMINLRNVIKSPLLIMLVMVFIVYMVIDPIRDG
jgi:hypothetical protein